MQLLITCETGSKIVWIAATILKHVCHTHRLTNILLYTATATMGGEGRG